MQMSFNRQNGESGAELLLLAFKQAEQMRLLFNLSRDDLNPLDSAGGEMRRCFLFI